MDLKAAARGVRAEKFAVKAETRSVLCCCRSRRMRGKGEVELWRHRFREVAHWTESRKRRFQIDPLWEPVSNVTPIKSDPCGRNDKIRLRIVCQLYSRELALADGD